MSETLTHLNAGQHGGTLAERRSATVGAAFPRISLLCLPVDLRAGVAASEWRHQGPGAKLMRQRKPHAGAFRTLIQPSADTPRVRTRYLGLDDLANRECARPLIKLN